MTPVAVSRSRKVVPTSGCTPVVAPNNPNGAGLTVAFACPDPVSGTTRSILTFGATAGNATDDDATAIQNAINASSAGDEVFIPDGVYDLKTADIALKTGVSIRGQSQAGTILRGTYTVLANAMFDAAQGLSNFTISNLSCTVNGGAGMDSVIELGAGSTATDNTEFSQVSRIAVKDCTFQQYNRWAVAVFNGFHVRVYGCTVTNATSVGGSGSGYGIQLSFDRCTENWIHNNTATGPMVRHAYVVQYRANHNLLEFNTADDTFSDSFDCHGEDEYSNEIRNNTATNAGLSSGQPSQNFAAGFGVGETPPSHNDTGPNNWLHHNTATGCYAGTRVTTTPSTWYNDNTFNSNIIGIRVGSPLEADSNVFKANTVRFNGTGVQLELTVGTVLDANTVTNNTGTGLFTTVDTTGYVITNNDFRNNGTNVNRGSLSGTYTGNLDT